MAAAGGTKAVRESEAKEPAAAQPSRTPLNRAVQSKRLLEAAPEPETQEATKPKKKAAPEPETQEATEPKKKRLRRQNATQIKESLSTGSLEVPPAKYTAAKAKAVPAKQEPKHDQTGQSSKDEVDPAVARSVAECLARSSTADIAEANSQEPAQKQKEPAPTAPPSKKKKIVEPEPTKEDPPPPPSDPSDQSGSEDEDSEDERERELVRAKREAHARYMRFSRSLSGPLAIN